MVECEACGATVPRAPRCPRCGVEGAAGGASLATRDDGSGGLDLPPEPLPLADESGDFDRFSSGSSMVDALLGGGWALCCSVLVHGPAGGGKTTALLAYLPVRPLCVFSLEMPGFLLRATADRAGASMRGLHFAERFDLRAATACRARAIIVDSVSMLDDPVRAGRLCGAWARAGRFAALVAHETKGGTFAGSTELGHDPDAVMRISGHDKRRVRFRVQKSRFGPAGSKLVPRTAQSEQKVNQG